MQIFIIWYIYIYIYVCMYVIYMYISCIEQIFQCTTSSFMMLQSSGIYYIWSKNVQYFINTENIKCLIVIVISWSFSKEFQCFLSHSFGQFFHRIFYFTFLYFLKEMHVTVLYLAGAMYISIYNYQIETLQISSSLLKIQLTIYIYT